MNRSRFPTIALFALVVALLGGLALVILQAQTQAQSRTSLERSFEVRGTLDASFTSSFVRSEVADERKRARHTLAAPHVTDARFADTVSELDFPAAVLLDSHGRLLKIWPPRPSLLGTNLSSRYPHLRAALAGRIGVSNVVPSAARGLPVIAFAVPFTTSAGRRRVFSAAFAIANTPLSAYLNTATTIVGAELTLVDGTGKVVLQNDAATRRTAVSVDSGLPLALRGGDGTYRSGGVTRFYVVRRVPGTPWKLVLSAPVARLFAPLDGLNAAIPWIVLAALAAAAAAMLALFLRLMAHRAELADANDTLAGANEELRALDRLKDEFVALVSHELRTPLTSIIGYVKLLRRGRAGPVPPAQLALLGVVDRNATRLVRLVGDLLVAAKIDAGKLELEPEPLELDDLARDCVLSAYPHAEEQGVTLTVQRSPAPVFADRARIVQLLDNLVSNAVKFTPEGGRVDVRVSSHWPAAVIEITDTGIGIPAAEQPRLFERFFRASSATSRGIEGSGLGLAVVGTIVELHGGTISCASVEDVGTTFRVTLPLRASELAAA